VCADSDVRTIYENLLKVAGKDEEALIKERLEDIDPNIRFCKYNLGDKSGTSNPSAAPAQGELMKQIAVRASCLV
jgi:hypothetical protein